MSVETRKISGVNGIQYGTVKDMRNYMFNFNLLPNLIFSKLSYILLQQPLPKVSSKLLEKKYWNRVVYFVVCEIVLRRKLKTFSRNMSKFCFSFIYIFFLFIYLYFILLEYFFFFFYAEKYYCVGKKFCSARKLNSKLNRTRFNFSFPRFFCDRCSFFFSSRFICIYEFQNFLLSEFLLTYKQNTFLYK